MEIAIMLEGQMGLNWPRLKTIATAVEDLGFAGLFRSDHFTNPSPPDDDALELWTSLTWLADNTERIEFGPLVSPFSFRHPSNIARMAAAVDDLSGGRLQLGLGAGWQQREHENFGFTLGSVNERFQRLEEGLEVVSRFFASDQAFDFEGQFYQLNDAILLPRPQRAGGPPIIIGGNGMQRTLPLAVKYAAEWNGVSGNVAEFEKRNQRLDSLLEQAGRDPSEIRRSIMLSCNFTYDDKETIEIVSRFGADSVEELRQHGVIIGTGAQIVEQLQAYQDAGAHRVMLQWLSLDDLDRLAAMAETILPAFGGN